MDRGDQARAARAARRRQAMTGEVVIAGTPKALLYAALGPEERFRAMARLCERQWLVSGRPLPDAGPRNTWPGGVFPLPWAQ